MTHIFELLLQNLYHVFLDHQVMVVQVLDDEVMVDAVQVHNDGLDSRLALDEHALENHVSKRLLPPLQ